VSAKIKITWISDTSLGLIGSFVAGGRIIEVMTHRERYNRKMSGLKGYVHSMRFLTRDGGVVTVVRKREIYEAVKTTIATEAARFVADLGVVV